MSADATAQIGLTCVLACRLQQCVYVYARISHVGGHTFVYEVSGSQQLK